MKRFLLTLLLSAVALAAVGAIIAAVSGHDLWRGVMWAFVVGGGVLVVVNVAGSGPGRPTVDPHTGFGSAASIQDAATSAGWLVIGVALIGLGVLGLFAA